ncbi:GNAT family N-acetyltransferase [Paenarthrobacter sp. Z7-10]|nr:GNAT family N-acetyltransferase [Paenarthrobacter sp. Z7-10]
MKALIRPAVDEDVAAILRTQRAAGRTKTGAGALEAAISDLERFVVVAAVDKELVGWGKTHCWSYADGPALAGHYLGGVTVAPEWRRRGIGADLAQARLNWIWQRSALAWYVVNASNTASIALHQRWGFAEAARAAKFHSTEFSGGVGLLLRASRERR